MSAVLGSDAPVWLLEGAKKALAVMQLGLAAVGFEGVEGWHRGGSTELLDDFAAIPLAKRRVELVPDGDVSSNAYVTRGIARFAEALTRRGAVVRVRLLA
jgi:hypothetical protein